MPISMSMISSNVGGFTKRATVSAIYFIMYCAGNIIGPQLFFSWQAPKYQNRRRDRMEIETESPGEKHADIEPNSGLADITDFENLRFRYVY
ncbi:hypothetical protein N7474_000729 [Penicillium riverlandense]|uniref:uncharacterized protein n=1 Tax=Penicillium riverlandense TaxID=1903569 RepID=UPI00254829EF|nr:uncharacterized protein N7474_000729 [Penicillium riverlandense]KAJ5832418.1 hypothetical protein N7474_000729 [Penicillium riverlandense]